MIWTAVSWGAFLLLLAAAIWYDIALRRIPNWLVALGLVAGLLCNGLMPEGKGVLALEGGGGLGWLPAVLGALTGAGMLLPIYMVRAMGAGDVKLMAALGAFLDPMQIAGAVLLTYLAGGLLSFLEAWSSHVLSRVLANVRMMMFCLIAGREMGMVMSEVPTTGRLPYALAIGVGCALQLLLASHGGWIFV